MSLKCSVIFLIVVFAGYATAVDSEPECNSKEVRCADGRCKPVAEGCTNASMLRKILTPSANAFESSIETKKETLLPPHQEISNHSVPACRLRLQSEYVYQCRNETGDYGDCNATVSAGTTVWVSPRVRDGTPLVVYITCGLNGTYNIHLRCMREIEELQKEFHDISINKIVAYEEEMNNGNQNVSHTKTMVLNYNYYKTRVQEKLDQILYKMKECDLYFHLYLNQFDDEIFESFRETDMCDLPPTPKNGRYEVLSQVQSPVPTEIPVRVFVLRYVCDDGFTLIGTKFPRCINRIWLDEFPHCSAACKLEKKSGFKYHCPKPDTDDDACSDYVTVGSVVKVSRLGGGNATATISCLNSGAFNLSTDCVEEVEDRQRALENPTMEKMLEYETKFNEMKDNAVSYEFEALVHEFHSFEKSVVDKLHLMHQKAEECDIYMDLMIP